MKLHALVETQTKTILSWRLAHPSVHETLELPTLLAQARARLREVYADAGYLSRTHCFEVRAAGATPYIRTNVDTGPAQARHTAFNDMVRSHQADPARWLSTYHRRNGVESTFAALKRRLGGALRSLARQALRIEACLKLVVWILTRVGIGAF